MTEDVLDTLQSLVGQEVGVSDFVVVTSERGSHYAAAVGIPLPERIPPLLLVSLIPHLLASSILPITEPLASINYGLESVRSVRELSWGTEIRARATLEAVDLVGRALQLRRLVAIEEPNGDDVLLATTLSRLVY